MGTNLAAESPEERVQRFRRFPNVSSIGVWSAVRSGVSLEQLGIDEMVVNELSGHTYLHPVLAELLREHGTVAE